MENKICQKYPVNKWVIFSQHKYYTYIHTVHIIEKQLLSYLWGFWNLTKANVLQTNSSLQLHISLALYTPCMAIIFTGYRTKQTNKIWKSCNEIKKPKHELHWRKNLWKCAETGSAAQGSSGRTSHDLHITKPLLFPEQHQIDAPRYDGTFTMQSTCTQTYIQTHTHRCSITRTHAAANGAREVSSILQRNALSLSLPSSLCLSLTLSFSLSDSWGKWLWQVANLSG